MVRVLRRRVYGESETIYNRDQSETLGHEVEPVRSRGSVDGFGSPSLAQGENTVCTLA